MVKVGVVGLGFMGVTHLKAYQKIAGVQIAAVCDAVRQPQEDGWVAGVSGNVGSDDGVRLDMSQTRAFKDFNQMLAEAELDLVDLCVPTSAHLPLSKAALEAGKHVVCEKPLARTSEQARQIVAAADGARGYFLPAMCMRFWPGWTWLKEAIDTGAYGRVLAAGFRRLSAPPGWSRGTYFKGSESGGALLDLHIHDTDFVQFCFGRPRRVMSRGLTRFSGAIDHVVTQYDVGTDAVVYAEGTWVMTEGFPFTMTYTVVFEKATADYDLARGDKALMLYEEGKPGRSVELTGEDGYVGELSYIVECIRTQTPPKLVTARDALSAVEICEAEEKSALSGAPVEL